MNRLQVIPPALFAILAAAWLAGLFLSHPPASCASSTAEAAPAADISADETVPSPAEVDFAPLRLRVRTADASPIPARTLALLRIAMRAALDAVPADAPATLSVELRPPPGFFERLFSPRRADALAYQQDDEIVIRADPATPPILLSNRAAHEMDHWLLRRACAGRRPPLWLDEGHAVLVGRAAAATAARNLRQKLLPEPPLPSAPRYTLDQLLAIDAYPSAPDAAAVFYAQSRTLVENLISRHGRPAFLELARDLAAPSAPALPDLLRTRYYATPDDLARLLPDS